MSECSITPRAKAAIEQTHTDSADQVAHLQNIIAMPVCSVRRIRKRATSSRCFPMHVLRK